MKVILIVFLFVASVIGNVNATVEIRYFDGRRAKISTIKIGDGPEINACCDHFDSQIDSGIITDCTDDCE